MKLTLILTTAMILFSSSVYAGGNEGGSAGGNGSHPKMFRGIASVEDDFVDNYAKDCLHKLGSNFKIDTHDKDYRAKIDKEIKSILDEKIKNSPNEIDSRQLPECYAYADETENSSIKSIISPKANKTFENPERNISSGSSK